MISEVVTIILNCRKGVQVIMKRRTAREKALQALFQIDVSNNDPVSAIEHVLENGAGDDYLNKLANGVTEHQEEIDTDRKENLEKWTMERLATVDRNLLRMAVYEMKYCLDEVPAN